MQTIGNAKLGLGQKSAIESADECVFRKQSVIQTLSFDHDCYLADSEHCHEIMTDTSSMHLCMLGATNVPPGHCHEISRRRRLHREQFKVDIKGG